MMIMHRHCCVEQGECVGDWRRYTSTIRQIYQDVCNGFSHYRNSYACSNFTTVHEYHDVCVCLFCFSANSPTSCLRQKRYLDVI